MFRESNTKWMLGKWPGCLEVCRSQLQICPSVCRPWFALGGQMSCTTKSKGLRIDTWVIIAYLPEVFQWSTVTQGNSQVVCFLICLKWSLPWAYIPEHVFFVMQTVPLQELSPLVDSRTVSPFQKGWGISKEWLHPWIPSDWKILWHFLRLRYMAQVWCQEGWGWMRCNTW